MPKVTIAMLLFTSYAVPALAQEYPQKEINLEVLADELFGFQDDDLNYEELYENIALLLANPININKATAEELRFLNLLSELQIQNLLAYRNQQGPLLSVYELQAIPGFDLTTIYKIIAFVKVEDTAIIRSLWQRILNEENNYLILRYGRTLQTKRGFTNLVSENARFKGSNDDLYVRFRTSKTGDFSIGFTLQQDAGEALVWNKTNRQYGVDFHSFHIQVMNKGNLKNLIIGDYQTQFAQGLVLGGNFGYGKGGETIGTVRRANLGFLPYTSLNEIGYKRGLAFTWQLTPTLTLSPFYSSAWRDASLATDTLESSFATSLQTTGLHRNQNELRSRKKLLEQNYGATINYRKRSVDAGLTFSTIHYNKPVVRQVQPYNQFSFSGNQNINAGAFLNYTLNNFTFFSEAAQTINHGLGLVLGMLGSLTNKLDVALHYRNFQRNFYSLYSNAFAESSIPQNESGIYWGWKYKWNRKFSAAGYADVFRFPWLRYRSYQPSEGHEWLFRFNYQPSRSVLIFLQAREESKVRNLTSESNLYLTDEGKKRNYWFNVDYGIGQQIRLKTRAQFSTFEFDNLTTNGMTLLQDVSYERGKFSITGRYALFDTDNYDNRQYVYERDVWLAYSLPAYSGKGIRNYILLQYTLNKKITTWLRWAQTRYTDRDVIGTGADTITGKTRDDIKLQLRYRF
jgi:hypothetical protein